MNFDRVRQIADAVLYEGYVLYPYRASALKNRYRWQFGVIAPRGYAENGGCESWEMQTECLVERHGGPVVDAAVRFLHAREGRHQQWDEGESHEVIVNNIDLEGLVGNQDLHPFEAGGAIRGLLRISAERDGDYLRLRLRVENLTPWPAGKATDRTTALNYSLTGAHTILELRGGDFVSLTNPPAEAKDAASRCANLHTWPVLAGEAGKRDVVLSSPIILCDYPVLAPESPGGLCDSTEIDELLTLRIMTLTEEEKAEARATDDRSRRIIERTDAIPREMFERLHGAVRRWQPSGPESVEQFFNPPEEMPPEHASVQAGEMMMRAGDQVRIHPRRRADSMDLFLAGRLARIEAVHRDVDGRTHVAVALNDEAGDMNNFYNRFFYFDPDELEPVGKRKE